jgi:uncharacterized membrane protein
VGSWGLGGATGWATGTGTLTGAGGGGSGAGALGGGGGVLQPDNQSAVRQAMKRALLLIFGKTNCWSVRCVSNGVMLNKPSKPWVAFCHCTVWFE